MCISDFVDVKVFKKYTFEMRFLIYFIISLFSLQQHTVYMSGIQIVTVFQLPICKFNCNEEQVSSAPSVV